MQIDMDRSYISRYVGSMDQLCGIKSYVFDEGRARGVKAFEVNSGAGMRFTVLPDRGMDISWAEFEGRNVVYLRNAPDRGPCGG